MAVSCVASFGQGDNFAVTYNNQGSPMVFLLDSVITVQRLDTLYKQAGIKIGGGYSEWDNIEDGCAFFKLPQMKDNGLYAVELYLGTQRSEFSYSGSSYIDKGLYIRVRNGRKSLAVNEYVLANNKEFVDRPYYPDLITAPQEDIQSDDNAIAALARKITRSCKTDFDRVAAVHDWVAAHIYYDMDAYRAGVYVCDAISVLNTRKGVCQGYANLCAALLRSLKIPCAVVSGYALGVGTSGAWDRASLNDESNHAWNFAYPDNTLVIFDATWDSILRYERKKYGTKDDFDLPSAELRLIQSGSGTSLAPGKRYFHLTVEGLSIDHRITSVPEPERR